MSCINLLTVCAGISTGKYCSAEVCMYVRMYVCTMYVCTYVVCMFVCMYVCTHVVCMFVCMYVHVYVCSMYVQYVCVYTRTYMNVRRHFLHSSSEYAIHQFALMQLMLAVAKWVQPWTGSSITIFALSSLPITSTLSHDGTLVCIIHINHYAYLTKMFFVSVVAEARKSTVIFNCIDHGQYFDYAVSSLWYVCASNHFKRCITHDVQRCPWTAILCWCLLWPFIHRRVLPHKGCNADRRLSLASIRVSRSMATVGAATTPQTTRAT